MVSKTFAIITDIHSNLASLTHALSLIDERDDIDQIICLGDCFALGPEPEKTLELLKTIPNCIFIRGNHDRYLLEKLWEDELPSLEGMDPYDPICQAIVKNEKWTADLLGQEGRDFCKSMEIAHREIVGSTLVEFTHAWYKRDDKPPSIVEAMHWRDHVIEANPEIKKVIFIHGHVHVPRHQVIENLTILCQGATGLPFDRDQRGSVAFLTVENGNVNWDVNRYNYDLSITTNQLEKRRPPFFTNLQNTIKFASIRNDL
ncbi:metallophosphatase family protein [Candidatus Marinimicrobia bacterium]|nr:metallophosphatase family protein [Candidatus Neomarinimicrobiota bacterium]MDC1038010.1 metallophosphoesterase [Candidatus Neomarinimicrobiota bacterium]